MRSNNSEAEAAGSCCDAATVTGVLRGASGRTGAKVLLECFFIDVPGVDQPELTRRSSRAIALGIAAFWNG